MPPPYDRVAMPRATSPPSSPSPCAQPHLQTYIVGRVFKGVSADALRALKSGVLSSNDVFSGRTLFPQSLLEGAGGGAFIRSARTAATAFANWQVRPSEGMGARFVCVCVEGRCGRLNSLSGAAEKGRGGSPDHPAFANWLVQPKGGKHACVGFLSGCQVESCNSKGMTGCTVAKWKA
eukprot:362720-Chlamydomonas_euryale.AAC.1